MALGQVKAAETLIDTFLLKSEIAKVKDIHFSTRESVSITNVPFLNFVQAVTVCLRYGTRQNYLELLNMYLELVKFDDFLANASFYFFYQRSSCFK